VWPLPLGPALTGAAGAVIVYDVPQGVYTNPPSLNVEGDASSATYPLALAAVTGGSVTVANVGAASTQGDAQVPTRGP
jgi:pentafunctional AROM polypeptide